ncbi:helix-turn-helix domain-containing protein [Kiloniella sp. EL199]|uniref:helix-turn-helix domain-containing protein n=1 Tax=Kiloniella sp. EL199 TaxID=2107581 RepID=UPI0013C44264|nr:helix-turn-helix transcriptional regulator [Kiloniella sp. EL199]
MPIINNIHTNNVTIGVNIRYTRLLKNISISDLAHKVGVKVYYIQRCEAGETEIPPPLLQDIANVLGVTIATFINTTKRVPTSKESYLSKALKAINELEDSIIQNQDDKEYTLIDTDNSNSRLD